MSLPLHSGSRRAAHDRWPPPWRPLASALAIGLYLTVGSHSAIAAVKAPAPTARTNGTNLPDVNLRVEWRQIDEAVLDASHLAGEAVVVGTGGGTTVAGGRQWSTERRAANGMGLHGVQLQVRNGGSAQLSWQRDQSMEWVDQALLPSTAAIGVASTAGTAANSTAGATTGGATGRPVGGFSRQLVWLPSGQQLNIHVKWPGGTQPVAVDVGIEERTLEPSSGSNIPEQQRRRIDSMLLAPLGAWITLARSSAPAGGDAAAPSAGTTSTLTLRQPRTLLQMRLSLAGARAGDTTPRP